MISSCTRNGTAILIQEFNTIDCEGPVINETIVTHDALELHCEGSICEHAVIRNYDDADCDIIGHYTEFPFPVNQCFVASQSEKDAVPIKFHCNEYGIYTRKYNHAANECSGEYSEWIAWDIEGHCNDRFQWTQFVECKANIHKTYFMVFMTLILNEFFLDC